MDSLSKSNSQPAFREAGTGSSSASELRKELPISILFLISFGSGRVATNTQEGVG
jgi:hypothetical protein